MSKVKTASLPPSIATDYRREFWGHMFGEGIKASRERAGISVEEAAGLSGMETSEWAAIEAGYVPQDINRLRAMAAAMEVRYDMIATMALLCREAWEL